MASKNRLDEILKTVNSEGFKIESDINQTRGDKNKSPRGKASGSKSSTSNRSPAKTAIPTRSVDTPSRNLYSSRPSDENTFAQRSYDNQQRYSRLTSGTPTTDPMERYDEQMRDKRMRRESGTQSFGDRVYDTSSAILSGSAGNIVNAAGFTVNAVRDPDYNRRQIAAAQKALSTGRTSDGKRINDAQRKTLLDSIDRMSKEIVAMESENSVANRLYRAADSLNDDSELFRQSAKEGLGSVGSTIVDASVAMGESMLSAAAGAATGTGMLPFVASAFGGATQDARRNGADLDEQFLYGSAQAAKEYVTEKLFGLAVPQKMLGKAGAGFFSVDDGIENGIRNVTERLAKTEGGQRVLGGLMTWLAGGATEGLEEGIGSVIENTLINPNLRGFDPDTRTTQQKFEDGLYDMLIGSVSGLMGVTNLFSYNPSTQNIGISQETDPLMQAAQEMVQQETERNQAQEDVGSSERMYDGKFTPASTNAAESRVDTITKSIESGKRVSQDSLSNEQFAALADREDTGLDATGKVYRIDPAQHISQRSADTVGSRGVNAFQFDHPELQTYYKQAAQQLINDASLSLDAPSTTRKERGMHGNRFITKIMDTPSLRYAMDMGLSRTDIIKAANDLIADKGQENNAAAKRLEIVLDEMLTNGYTTARGETVQPNAQYIAAKQRIPGYTERVSEELPIFDMDVPTSRNRRAQEIAYDIQSVKEAATSLGYNGSKVLSGLYTEAMASKYAPNDIVKGFYYVYNDALTGKKASEEHRAAAEKLPDDVRKLAESAGQEDDRRAAQARYFGDKAGLVRDANWKKAHLSSKTSRVLDALAKTLGVEIRFAKTVADGTANAQYENGVITIALDANDPVLTSAIHEAIHRLRESSPDAYVRLAEFVRGNMSGEAIDSAIKGREMLYQTKDVDYLSEEMVADAFGRMMGNEELMIQFVQDNRSLAQKIADSLRDIINAVARVLENQNLKLTDNQVAEFQELKIRLNGMEKVFADALKHVEGKPAQEYTGATESTTKQSIKAVEFSDANTKYSLRKKDPPKKTGIAYKVFYAKDGQLYPPMVANPGGEGTPVGVWLDADIGKKAAPSKTGRPQVQGGGKGTNAGKMSLSFRPGWHLGDIPQAKQFARKNPETGVKDLFPADFVWAECEYAMDVDYQEEAMSYGYTENGKFRHSYAGLPKLPVDGYYRYRTNPNPDTVPWVITGAMKVTRILTDAETDAICRENGVEPMKRQGGPIDLAKLGLEAGDTEAYNSGKKYALKEDGDDGRRANEGNASDGLEISGRRNENRGGAGRAGRETSAVVQYKNLSRKAKGKVRSAILSAISENAKDGRDALATFGSESMAQKIYDQIVVNDGSMPGIERMFPTLREKVAKAALEVEGIEKDYVVTEATGKAAWTQEHIDKLYEAFSVTRTDIDRDYSKAYAVTMSPEQFLSLTATEIGRANIELEAVKKYGELDVSKLKEDQLSPQLYIDMENGVVDAHEGRHRMVLLQNAGIDSVPVVVIPSNQGDKYHRTKIGRLRVSGQEWSQGKAPGNVTLKKLIPLSQNYKPEIEQTFGGDAEVRFSLKDSAGNTLTDEQQKFFKDSKVRDKDGNLLVVYHGTGSDFTVFDKSRVGENYPGGISDLGFYFTPYREDAVGYASNATSDRSGRRVMASYLNLKNPLIVEDEGWGSAASQADIRHSDLMRWAKDGGHDGIIVRSTDEIMDDDGTADAIYIAFNSNQIKDVTNENPTEDTDIRFSLKDSTGNTLEDGRQDSHGDTRLSKSNRNQLDEYVKQYGSIPKGEKPARDVILPSKTSEDKKLSQTVRTILEAQATPNEAVPKIEELVAKGDFSYDVYTDKQAIEDAATSIKKGGWAEALTEWTKAVERGEVSKTNTAMGWALYNNAANSGDMDTALTILDNMVKHQRSAAQAVQATRILKKLSPETQLYQVQRSVESLQEELNKRYGDKKAPELKIDTDLAEQYMKAKDQTERDAVLRDIYRDIGRQMPSRFRDKWNAWRYLAMLGNPRTHVRNIVGNAGFAPVVAAKNLTATAIESAVYRVSGGKLNRTKSLVGVKDKALLSAAWNDFANVQDTAMSGGKYSDFANANKYIEEGRVIFKTKPLEAARRGNSKALDAEDMWFSKPHYASAMASYCKAHNITAEQVKSGKGLKEARAYAVKEAQKATYRDTNALSYFFTRRLSERGEFGKAGKYGNLFVEGILPFRKTPANILARGVEYSPLGLANGIKQALFDVKAGKKTGAEAIDSISAGLTGTGLMTLGFFMAAQALVRGHGDDDDDKRDFEDLMGHQAYALELPDGTSVTLDWLAPEALPYFIGVNLWEMTEGEKVTLDDWFNAVKNVSEPLLEMSCLQSLNDALEAVGNAYSNDSGGLGDMIINVATSYVTQAFPTIAGQIERVTEDKRYTTYTGKDSVLPSDWQYTIGKISGKTPGEYRQIPYIDAWGRTESTGNVGQRAFNNLLNPAYMSKIDTSKMEEELLRLYESTGEAGVLPSRAAKYFTVNKERKDLTGDEYVLYATKKGQISYELISDLTSSSRYQSMSDEEKVKAVRDAYDLANQQAKAAVSVEYEMDSWIAKAADAEQKYHIPQETYISLKSQVSGIQSLKDRDGETIDNSRSLQIMQSVYNTPGLTDRQRHAMFAYLGVGKSIRHWNRTLVNQKLKEMQKLAG